MPGGHRYRGFFYGQALEFITLHNKDLPNYTPTVEEEEAGIPNLTRVFGFYAVLINTAQEMNLNPELLLSWSAREFYHLTKYLAWRRDASDRYRSIMTPKK